MPDDMLDSAIGLVTRWAEMGLGDLRALGDRNAALLIAALVALGVLVLLRRKKRSNLADAAALSSSLRWPRRLGFAAILLGLAGFGGWSSTALLASAAVAPAVVSPDGYRKTVQHLEGGIVQAIHVQEGDTVVAGQVLLTLEDTQARARYEELRERLAHLLAMEARLEAEQNGAAEITFPQELFDLERVGAQQRAGQQELLGSRVATQLARQQILQLRIRQLEEEINGLRDVIAAQDTQSALIAREIAGVQQLYDQGLERLPRLLALQRAQADLRAEQAANRARIARNKQQIGETEMQIVTRREEDRERVNEELTKVRAGLAELRSQFPSRHDILSRTAVKAPIAGTVMNMRIHTETGVIAAGQALLDIVPSEAKLIIDARIKPLDVDVIHPGMRARVVLTGYRQRTLPQIFGSLRSVSADRLADERSGEAYFLARVDVDPEELMRLADVRLSPGMPAEVMILTGERTFLDYLLDPVLQSISRSFREQ